MKFDKLITEILKPKRGAEFGMVGAGKSGPMMSKKQKQQCSKKQRQEWKKESKTY